MSDFGSGKTACKLKRSNTYNKISDVPRMKLQQLYDNGTKSCAYNAYETKFGLTFCQSHFKNHLNLHYNFFGRIFITLPRQDIQLDSIYK